MIRKISSLILIVAICLLYVSGCRQVVVYEYELSGVIKSVSGNKVIVQVVDENACGKEYEYWYREYNSYFSNSENYEWNAVYPLEDTAIELKVSDEWLKSNNLEDYVDFSRDRMINFTIENDTITDMDVSEIPMAYKRDFDKGIKGELFPGNTYTVMILDDSYSVSWSTYLENFYIYMYNTGMKTEYNLGIIDCDLARCYLLDSEENRIDFWVDSISESLLVSITDEITVTAYEGSLLLNEDGTIANELLDESESSMKVIDFITRQYLTINYK